MGKLTLILGGARSGKSSFAERLASASGLQVVYIATAQPLDDEMAKRIVIHRKKRPKNWLTLEIPKQIAVSLSSQKFQADLILLDCLSLLVSNLIVDASVEENNPDEYATGKIVETEIEQLLETIRLTSADWIIVSNEVGMGLVPPYPLGRLYRDLLGWTNQQIAAFAQEVYFMVAGIPMHLHPAKLPPSDTNKKYQDRL